MAKAKKPIVPKIASTEALRVAHELLEVGETDLRAALALHGTAFFPQAVFYLQQGVEKIGKAFGLAIGFAEPGDLQKDWSHNTLKHSELFANYSEQQGLLSSGMPSDKIRMLINELREPDRVNGAMMDFVVEWALSIVHEHEAYTKDSKKREEGIAEMTPSVIGQRTDPAEVAKATALGEILADLTLEAALILPTTIVLGMATLPHAVLARYPSANMTPSQRYTADYPVVGALPRLCVVGARLAVSVRTLCALAARLAMILPE